MTRPGFSTGRGETAWPSTSTRADDDGVALAGQAAKVACGVPVVSSMVGGIVSDTNGNISISRDLPNEFGPFALAPGGKKIGYWYFTRIALLPPE
jgi:hypothetical protein